MTKKLALIGAVLLTMLACGSPFDGLHRNEKGAGVLVIRLGANARTVVHDFSTDIDQVDIVLTSKDGYATKNGTVVLPQTSHTFESIEAGTWDIRVTARNGEAAIGTGVLLDKMIASGVTTDVTIPVIFPAGDGNGSLSLRIRFPSGIGVDYVSGMINNVLIVPEITSSGGESEATIAAENLPAGYDHDLVLTFKRGGAAGTAAGAFLESVNIWSGLISDRWIDAGGQLSDARTFATNEFFDPNSSLSDLHFSAAGISFVPATLNYDLGTVWASAITFTPTEAMSGQYIRYRVNGASWIGIASATTSLPLQLAVGANTLEILVTAPDQVTQTTYAVSITLPLLYTINHTNFDPSSNSEAEIDEAKTLRVYFEHASVGGNIFSDWYSGYSTLAAADPRFTCGRVHWDTDPNTNDPNPVPPDHTWFETNTGLADLARGNPHPTEKINHFHDTFSDSAFAATLDVASFKFCFIDTTAFYSDLVAQDLFNRVKATIEELRSAYPNITFFWWTMPLETYAAPAVRQEYNNLVRSYCSANNGWLLDIADLESHDDEGNAVIDGDGRERLYTPYSTDGGHLNMDGAVKIARAYWRLICEIGKTK